MNIDKRPQLGFRVVGHELDGSEVCCTGRQTALLLQKLNELHTGTVWYASDLVWSTGVVGEPGTPMYLGDDVKTVEVLSGIDQFFSGILLGFEKGNLPKSFKAKHFTEDMPYSENEGALFEVRLFDTTYFEVYFSDAKFANKFISTVRCDLINH
ncbi:hypothetical protein [Pseudidiomarina sp.]|uniref:hypothetical protein n=1 Tax=Pseudidiomarina sp. TaxID=2081707 RepID=UPI003A96A060